MAETKVEYYQDKNGDWRWRRTAVNGEITGASSEGYEAKKDCEANATRNGANDRWEFYKDKRGGFRWRAFSTANGKQIGKSTEAFKAKKDCEYNAGLNGWKG
jgi:uncharacterized protein